MNDYNDGNDELDIHREMDSHSGSWLKIIVPVMVVAVVAFIAYAWYTDKFALSHVDENVPIIRADTAPVRNKPQDPGGMVIPGRDKMVYGHISKDKEAENSQVTHVMPTAEEPVSRGTLMQEENIEADSSAEEEKANNVKKLDLSEPENEEIAEESEEGLEEILPLPSQGTTEMPMTQEAALKNPEVAAKEPEVIASTEREEVAALAEKTPAAGGKKLDIEPEKAKPGPVKKVTASDIKKSPVAIRKGEVLTLPDPTKKHGNYIQLGSFRNQKEVGQHWQKLQKSYPDLLKKVGYISEKADLNEQGIFYRLQIGPFKSERDARKLCQELTERKQRCFFVK